MNPFRGLGALIASYWRYSRRVRFGPNRGLKMLYIFLLLIFLTVALVLLGLGVELDEADRWLDRNGNTISLTADWLWRGVCGVVLLICAALSVSGLIDWGKRIYGSGSELGLDQDAPPPRTSGCMVLGALVVGYFAWLGMTMTY